MSNKKMIGFALIGLGAVLLYFGYNASQSLGSSLKQAWTGSMSDKATLLYVAGAVSAAVGAYFAFMTKR